MDRLLYRMSYKGKSVVFALNDLSEVKPPPGVIGPDEKYLGPVFDESAIRFFLVYNPKLKVFHFILDETGKVADEFFKTAGAIGFSSAGGPDLRSIATTGSIEKS